MKINKQKQTNNDIALFHENDNSININIPNNEMLMEIVGSFDNNLKKLKMLFNT